VNARKAAADGTSIMVLAKCLAGYERSVHDSGAFMLSFDQQLIARAPASAWPRERLATLVT